jgi:hypothetical protein
LAEQSDSQQLVVVDLLIVEFLGQKEPLLEKEFVLKHRAVHLAVELVATHRLLSFSD